MSLFKIKIANKIIEIESMYVLPYAICRKYLAEGEPDICIKSTQEDINQLRNEYIKEYGVTSLWDGNLEAMVVFRKVVECLIDYNVFALHGAAVAVDGNAYLFSGKSGIGKTTHIRKWIENLPDSFVVNGDKPFIMMDDGPVVCGSPWAGKENMGTNTRVPLKAIVFLERNEDNCITKIDFSDAFPMLFQQSHRSSDINKMKKTLGFLKTLDEKVDFYRFQINNFKEDCFQTAYDALVGGDKRD